MEKETFFTEKDKKNIKTAINETESRTAGEIAVMVVNQSDDYPESLILAGVILGILPAFCITTLLFNDTIWIFLPIAFLCSILMGWLVNYLPSIKRFFTPSARLEDQVYDRALSAFYEKGLYKTRDETGVLFFISLFEHKVWVLADKGIYEKIKQDNLQQYAREVAMGVKSGKAADILCQEIKKIGDILAQNFPIKPDDINELSDDIILG